MKDGVNAMKDYHLALKKDPTYALAYFNAANIYFHTRHFKQVCVHQSPKDFQSCFCDFMQMFVYVLVFEGILKF